MRFELGEAKEEAARRALDVQILIMCVSGFCIAGLIFIRSVGAFGLGETSAYWAIGGVAVISSVAQIIAAILPIKALSAANEEAEAQLRRISSYDALTALPNRALLDETLGPMLARSARYERNVGLIHLDLSGLREINDRHGRGAGDEALRKVAASISDETRRGDFVARLDSTEFMIVLDRIADEDALEAVAKRIARKLSTPFDLGTATASLHCIAGVAFSAPGALGLEDFKRDAAVALRRAKNGGDEVSVCDASARLEFEAEHQLRDELLAALSVGQIQPWFQPQVDASTGEIVGFEALARWSHPRRGILTPPDFLPQAEAFGLAGRIDEAILASSLDAVAEWRANDLPVPHVGVNISAERLRDPYIKDAISWALEARDLPPAALRIEVLESVRVSDNAEDPTVKTLESLSRIGVGLDLDDFGTDRAAIATLSRLSVDRIKIDRSFIAGIDTSERRAAMVKAMIDLARTLEVRILAEGVETADERRKLLTLGCGDIQGFGVARPMPQDAVSDWIALWRGKSDQAPSTSGAVVKLFPEKAAAAG